MPLRITLLKSPESVSMPQTVFTFDEQGGSIGRGDENTLVLQDPERFLSTRHCQFVFEEGSYYLIDQSTNGTFYNGSLDPMGKGTRLVLSDQDSFMVGDYEFLIQLDQAAAGDSVLSAGAAPDPFLSPAQDIFTPDSQGSDPLDGFASNPFAGSAGNGADGLVPSVSSSNDPLAALDQANGGFSPGPEVKDSFSDPFGIPGPSESVDPLNQQVDWQQPSAPVDMGGALIPDDWDLDHAPDDAFSVDPGIDPPTEEIDMGVFLEAHGPVEPAEPMPSAATTPRPGGSARQRALETASARIQQEIETLKQQRAMNRQAASAPAGVDKTFIKALGLGDHELSDEEVTRINQLAGEVMREMVIGLMNVLGSRSAIKSEFRMNVTTIQPVENNPLKFSANVEDALENMFIRQGRAYKQPLDAVADGFQGVAEHQLAIIAGIREAFNSLLARFDPATLEEKFARQNKGGILPGSQKARNWELFADYYEELVGDMDRSFQYLFGDGFVRAYEEQLQKLAIKRKAQTNSD